VLSGEGLVVMEANRGATVRAIDAHFMEDIYEIRRVLEVYIVQRFIECAPQGAIEQIASIQAEMEAFEDAEALAERHACDIRFHQAIASAIDNSEIGLIVDRHTNIIDAVMRQFGQTPARLRQVRHEHRALVSALAGGNVELATQTVSDHFAHARADLSSLMRRAGRNAN
jgi:DNA-binding GntR family transcriptional regulator